MNTNDATRATAEGLPQINRRRLLLGLAAASAAAAPTTAEAAAVPENPELLRLGDELAAFEAGYIKALRSQTETAKEWAPKWPKPPAELLLPQGTIAANDCWYRDFFGAHHGVCFASSRQIEWDLMRPRSALRSRAANNRYLQEMSREEWQAEFDRLTRLQQIAKDFETERARVEAAANYEGAWMHTKAMTIALSDHITKIMDQPETSMVGVIIKAQALASWGRVDEWDQTWAVFKPNNWHGAIAAAILRHAEGGAA